MELGKIKTCGHAIPGKKKKKGYKVNNKKFKDPDSTSNYLLTYWHTQT